MKKINKNTVIATTVLAAIGGGLAYGGQKGAFEDGRFKIDNSPAVEQQLEKVIKPKMQELGSLAVDLAHKTQGKDPADTQIYNPKNKTVTIRAAGNDPVLGKALLTAEFGAKPGTEEPDPENVKRIETKTFYDQDDVKDGFRLELAAPGSTSTAKDLSHTATTVYSASEGEGVDYKNNPSLSGNRLLNTRDNEQFVDSSWNDYAHNPVPTAQEIVNDSDQAANIIRAAFEQPPPIKSITINK